MSDISWVEVAKELMARGESAPEVLVLALCWYGVGEEGRQGGGYPRAMAAVAKALGRDTGDVEREVIARTAKRAGAARAVRRVLNLRQALESIPAVGSVREFGPAEPEFHAEMARNYAMYLGVPLPEPEVSRQWVRLFQELGAHGVVDIDALFVLARFWRVALTAGEVAEALDEEDAYVTVAEVLGVDPAQLRSESVDRLASVSLLSGPNPVEGALHAEGVLAKLPGVLSVKRMAGRFPPVVIAKRLLDGRTPLAPWEQFSEEPGSLRWRMGPGEAYMGMWLGFWRSLEDEERAAYLLEHSPTSKWKVWLKRIEAISER